VNARRSDQPAGPAGGPTPGPGGRRTHEPGSYEIRIQGRLDDRWASWFDNMSLETEAGSVTVLRGHLIDQAALHGLLSRLRDLGLPLISVGPYAAPAIEPATEPATESVTEPATAQEGR
jgi:hypothetical protein